MAFSDLNFASGADKFTDFYTKYNATMDALKAGTSNFVLVANGATNAPTYQSFWSIFTVVGAGGGAPNYASNFTQTGSSGDYLRFRKSTISDTIEISGRCKRTTSTLAAGFSATIFILPSGYLPARATNGIARISNTNNDSITVIVDPSTGEVIIVNTTASSIAINTFIDITLRFPIS